jgi:hypothetical protein
MQDIPDDTVPVTAFLKELLGLATAQRPLLIFFDSIDELTGSQVCDNISGEFLRLAIAQHSLLIFFDSIDELTGSQACDKLSGEILCLATAQCRLLIFFDSIDELTGSQVCDSLFGEFLGLATAQCPRLIFFDSVDELTGSQVLRLATAQRSLFFYFLTKSMSLKAFRYVTTFLKELPGLATAQHPLDIFSTRS